MGFAIPINKVLEISNDLIHYGYVKNRVRLGITGTEIDQTTAEYYGIEPGILIDEVDEKGPLNGKNIQKNDILTSIDGKQVTSFQNVFAILETHKPGDKVKLTFERVKE